MTDWLSPNPFTSRTSNPSARALEGRWNKLQGQYREKDEQYESLRRDLQIRHGDVRWAPATPKKKLDRLAAQRDKIGDKMFDMLDKHSPRDWMHGVPSWWIYLKLPWADAIRPADEPLSETPPTAHGYREPMR